MSGVMSNGPQGRPATMRLGIRWLARILYIPDAV